ncbi:MAG: Gfo/Idh/MocA family oxidoreductase [Chloroflexota bacterium]
MKVVQVGIGGMGNVWLQTVLASKHVEFAGFVEVNDAVIGTQVARYGLDSAVVFPTLDEALSALEPDGVIDVTPPQFHRSVSLRALEAGVPVLSEKPLAPTLSEAREIVAAANSTGVLHMVAQNYRYSPAAQTLRQALDPAVIGEIGAVSIEFYKSPHFGGFREEMAYPLVVDMAIHHFDLLRFLLGANAVSVFGRSWNPAWSWYQGDASASALVEFPGGLTAAYNGSWCATGRETPWNGNWRFDCAKGVVSLLNDEVWVYPHGDQQAAHHVEPLTLTHAAQSYLLDEFYHAVTEATVPATTCQDNIHSLSIVYNLVESFRTGAVVKV